jgi:hypothetical protein
MPTTTPKAPVVHCRACGSHTVTVERGQQHRQLHGKRRTVVNVICTGCVHEWWSASRDAVARAKAADKAARR